MLVNNIRRLCNEKGISIRQLEAALGFTNGIVGSWKVKTPAVTRVKAVADFFGVTVDELLTDHEEEAQQ